ncbi:MAG: T9SS type A sorting domain-containing protein [Vulcanibacillus sp.]
MKRFLLFTLTIMCALNSFSAHNVDIQANNSKSLTPDVNGIIYVKSDGTGDGSSWSNATQDLQGAINAESVQQVWVAKGIYYASEYLPGETDDKMKSFQFKEGVHVYGNFNGDEVSINERDLLSINMKSSQNSVLTTNSSSYHIAIFDTTGYATETILDGFEITGGNADNISTPPHNFGGGVVLSPNSIVQNCFIHHNLAEIGAGAVLYKGGLIDSCYFASNTASLEGGGIAILYDGTVENSNISNNSTQSRGAGIYVEGYTGAIKNCWITDNNSDNYGAGVYFRDVPTATIQGSYVANNTSGKSRGGIYAYNSSINIYNCSVVSNYATTGYGGGINSYSNASAIIINSVFIANTATIGNNIYKCSSGCTTDVSYSGIEGGYEGENNVNISNDDFKSFYDELYDELYDGIDNINPPSKCLNSANNSLADAGSLDLNGNPRISFGIIDMGAFESTTCKAYNLTSTVPTGGGAVYPEDTSIYYNNSLTYNITPNANGVLDAVLFNSSDVTSKLQADGNNYIFTADTIKVNGELTVTFTLLPNVDITTSVSIGGSISPTNANIEYGSSQIFTLSFNEGYELDVASFSGSGTISDNEDGTLTLSNVTTSGELSITLKLKQYEITTSTGSGGNISPTTTTIDYGGNQVFTLSFDEGYELDVASFSGSGTVSDNEDGTITLSNVITSGELSVTFKLKQYEITTSTSLGGSISPTTTTIEHGGSQVFTLTFDNGYELDEATYSGNGTVSDNEDGTITLSNVISGGELSIIFAITSGLNHVENTIIIYPNPTTGYLKIIGVDLVGYSYTISDLSGMELFNGNFSNNNDIDISEIEKGTYILTLKSSENKESIKIIKN